MGLESKETGKSVISIRWDLGLRALVPEWKKMLSAQDLRADILAGITVACVAIPLSLAIALASHVDPAVGLTTAIIAGIVAAFFGGARLSVSGPAAAMAVIIAANVEKFGLGGLVVIGLLCGFFQLALGFFGLGKLIKFVPTPVISGFTAGIGVIILTGQLPRALGLPPADQGHVFDVISHLSEMIHETNFTVLGLCLTTLAIAKIIPRYWPILPAPLIAVVIPSAFAMIVGLDVPTVGDIPRFLPPPQLPSFPTEGYGELLANAFVIFALASLETLLSCGAVDKLAKGEKHDPDQEMIGQGISNIAVSFFGGIPVTGVIARSALNVRSGAKTRRSAIIHSMFILASVFVLAPLISRIPIATLAGMLIGVAISMIQIAELRTLWSISKGDAAVYLTTFAAMVGVDLIVGVQAGIVAALLIAVIRMGQVKVHFHQFEMTTPARFLMTGPLTFLSTTKFETVRSQIYKLKDNQPIILDLSRVTLLDASGAEMLLELVEELDGRTRRLCLKGLGPAWRKVLSTVDKKGMAATMHATTETDVERILHVDSLRTPRARLLAGVGRFHREDRAQLAEVFEALGRAQSPHTLFVTCSDSRIVPNLITSTDPGELFIVRNVGNIIPPFGLDSHPAEGAAIEYAIQVLGVREIVICGHTGCGAMAGLVTGLDRARLESVHRWLEPVKKQLMVRPDIKDPDEAAKLNVMLQIQNLATYPVVVEALACGELALHGWMYDVRNGSVSEWDQKLSTFTPLVAEQDLLRRHLAK